MNTLIVSHCAGSDPAAFEVCGGSERGPRVVVPSPVGFPVEGAGDSDLMAELRWYLETFLQYPFDPWTQRADRALAALDGWADRAFEALFGSRRGRELYAGAVSGERPAEVQVVSDEPRVLAWPWEALRDADGGHLALAGHVERRLATVDEPPPLSDRLPRDRVNILLVIARPYERDVQFRSISRPLVELAASGAVPAEVTVLRPPAPASTPAPPGPVETVTVPPARGRW